MCIHFDTRKNLNCVEKWRCKDVFFFYFVRFPAIWFDDWWCHIGSGFCPFLNLEQTIPLILLVMSVEKKMFASYNPIESQAVDTNSILRANQVDFVSRLLATIWPHWCQSMHFQCFFFFFSIFVCRHFFFAFVFICFFWLIFLLIAVSHKLRLQELTQLISFCADPS